jgi:hypothetical protein
MATRSLCRGASIQVQPIGSRVAGANTKGDAKMNSKSINRNVWALTLSLGLGVIGFSTFNAQAAEERKGVSGEVEDKKRGPSLPCCKCLGDVVTLDLSTGKASPIDPLWRVSNNPAYTIASTTSVPNWITLPPAKWIQPVNSSTPSSNVPQGLHKYTARFTIQKCLIPYENVRLDGKFAADNSAKVSLNGNPITLCAGPKCFQGPQAPVPLGVTPISWPATYTLEVNVTNDGDYSGLLVNAQLKGQCKK